MQCYAMHNIESDTLPLDNSPDLKTQSTKLSMILVTPRRKRVAIVHLKIPSRWDSDNYLHTNKVRCIDKLGVLMSMGERPSQIDVAWDTSWRLLLRWLKGQIVGVCCKGKGHKSEMPLHMSWSLLYDWQIDSFVGSQWMRWSDEAITHWS